MSSLQVALPNLQMAATYDDGVNQLWFPQNPVPSFVPGGVSFDSSSGNIHSPLLKKILKWNFFQSYYIHHSLLLFFLCRLYGIYSRASTKHLNNVSPLYSSCGFLLTYSVSATLCNYIGIGYISLMFSFGVVYQERSTNFN